MRPLYCILIFLVSCVAARAQNNYFFYLQTDNAVPFYIKTGDKLQSSSSAGYLILPGLHDGALQFAVGFPSVRESWRFRIAPDGRDRGFIIRRTENGAALYDWQSGRLIQPEKNEVDANVTYQERTDAFSKRLATAADDPGLLMAQIQVKLEPVVKTPPPKAEETVKPPLPLPAEVKDSSAVVVSKPETPKPKEEAPKKTVFTDTVQNATTAVATPRVDTFVVQDPAPKAVAEVPAGPAYQRSVIRKYSESSTSEGFGLVYFDRTAEGIDTVRLIIPNPRFQLRTGVTEDTSAALVERPVVVAKNSCSQVATATDFLKFRKSLAGETTDEAMVSVAKKYFKVKCYSTEQVRNLSVLFPTAAGKYLFFDAAYLHVTDAAAFSGLASEIHDTYYLKRFNALVGE